MSFAERAAARRKSKDLKNDLKEMRQHILNTNGGDKAQLTNDLKKFQESMELGATLYAEYADARMHLMQAREMIGRLLEQMGATPAAEMKARLKELVVHLEGVYHDCSIRRDDMDYQATLLNLRQMVERYPENTSGMQAIMLRSELENVKAVLDDTADWTAPDFLALAYFYLHADKNTLRDMENEQRNQFVLKYFKDEFMDELMGQFYRAGREMPLRTLIKEYIYE